MAHHRQSTVVPLVETDCSKQHEGSVVSGDNAHHARHAKEIWVKYNIFNIYQLDTVHQTFEARLNLEFTWEEPLLNGVSASHPIDWTRIWKPTRIDFLNAKDVEFKPIYEICTWEKRESGNAVITCYGIVRGVWDETFMLRSYPFDSQDCTVAVQLRTREYDLKYVRNPDRKSTFERSFVHLAEWDTLRPTDEHVEGTDMSSFCLRLRMKRKPQFVLIHVMFPLGLFTTITWLSYCIPYTNIGERLSCALTLLLTSVAFKLAATQDLPKLPYSTYVDHYIMANMIIQMIVCIHIGIGGMMASSDPDTAKLDDRIFALSSFFVGMFVQMYFAILGYHHFSTQDKTSGDKLREERKNIENLL